MVMLNIIGSPSHQSLSFSKTPSEGPGAMAPGLRLLRGGGGVARVQSDPVGASDKAHSLVLQERSESGRDWIEMQETGSNSRKRHRLRGVGPDQTGQEGMPCTSVLTQLPFSFSPGNATSQEKEE